MPTGGIIIWRTTRNCFLLQMWIGKQRQCATINYAIDCRSSIGIAGAQTVMQCLVMFLELHFDMMKWSKLCWNFTPSVTNQTHGRIIAKAWNNTARVMTWPVKYYTHVGVNQSTVILHVVVNVQHTLANQFLVMFEVLTNSKSRSNDMRQEWPTQKLELYLEHILWVYNEI